MSIEREKKANANSKILQANLETVESERLYMNEVMKQLNAEISEKKKQFDIIKIELHEANESNAYFKHEHSMALKQVKDARSDFQRCHEKESDVKDRMTKYKNQVDDISNRLAVKLAEIVSNLKLIKKLEKRNRETKRDYEKCQYNLQMCRNEIKDMQHDNKLLKDELRENSAQFTKMKAQIDKVLRERDLIANQMYRRADENTLLENEIATLRISIERGSAMYNERVEDVNILKNEVKSLRSQCNTLKRALENTTDTRHEVLQLHRKLNQEKTRGRALLEEMVTPMNVHRWRKLNQFDPTRMELLKKCHRLQRTALKRSTQITKSDDVIKALQQQIEELRKDIDKRPSIEVQTKLLLTRVGICFILC